MTSSLSWWGSQVRFFPTVTALRGAHNPRSQRPASKWGSVLFWSRIRMWGAYTHSSSPPWPGFESSLWRAQCFTTLSYYLTSVPPSLRFSFYLEATDLGTPPMSSRVLVEVDIRDVNDNQPIFEHSYYSANVSEDAAVGALLLVVSFSSHNTLQLQWCLGVTVYMGHTGGSRKSPNDAPWEILSQRLGRPISANPWHWSGHPWRWSGYLRSTCTTPGIGQDTCGTCIPLALVSV